MTIGKRQEAKITALKDLFAGPAHPVRAAIVYTLLREKTGEIRFLEREYGIPKTLLAHHLRILRRVGWVTRMKIGRVVSYSLNPEVIDRLRAFTSEFEKTL